jgi:hypothetical protein
VTERADQLHHDNAPASSRALVQVFFFLAKQHITHVCQPPTAQIWLFAASGFSQSKIAFEIEEICEFNGHTVHKISQRRLAAD